MRQGLPQPEPLALKVSKNCKQFVRVEAKKKETILTYDPKLPLKGKGYLPACILSRL